MTKFLLYLYSYSLIGSSGCGKTTLLSSIMGMIRLDSGSIKVLGQYETKKVGHRLGYMPQETALVGELTVKETVYYFGNIFEMNPKTLKERFTIIKEVLELPKDNLRVENCSGGEKRRISFAAAIIHEPDLLILDEPTVGLDPILREKIWSFLWNVTRNSQLSVIITTHYIAEAQKSDRVGLMRNGFLIAEDSPSIIMSHQEATNLDEAFLQICLKHKSTSELSAPIDDKEVKCETKEVDKIEQKRSNKVFRWQVLHELLRKEYRKYKRQPA